MLQFQPLRPIVLSNEQICFYDIESKSAIQMIGTFYRKFQELIDNYNAFVTDLNATIEAFMKDSNAEIECFEKCIKDLVDEYIEALDTKIDIQNIKIYEAIKYMKDNLITNVNNLFSQAIINGDIHAEFGSIYDGENKELTIFIQSQGGNE